MVFRLDISYIELWSRQGVYANTCHWPNTELLQLTSVQDLALSSGQTDRIGIDGSYTMISKGVLFTPFATLRMDTGLKG